MEFRSWRARSCHRHASRMSVAGTALSNRLVELTMDLFEWKGMTLPERIAAARAGLPAERVATIGDTVLAVCSGQYWFFLPEGEYTLGASHAELEFLRRHGLEVGLRPPRTVKLSATLIRGAPLRAGEVDLDDERPRAQDGCERCDGHAFLFADELERASISLGERSLRVCTLDEWAALIQLLGAEAPYVSDGSEPELSRIDASCSCTCGDVSGLGSRHLTMCGAAAVLAGGPCHAWPFQDDAEVALLLPSLVWSEVEEDSEGVIRPVMVPDL